MTAQPESRLVAKMIARINALDCPSLARKTHGSAYTRRGEPDIDAVICGVAVKIEVKMPGNTPKPIQHKRLREWSEAGAVAGWCDSLDGLDDLIDEALRRGGGDG